MIRLIRMYVADAVRVHGIGGKLFKSFRVSIYIVGHVSG